MCLLTKTEVILTTNQMKESVFLKTHSDYSSIIWLSKGIITYLFCYGGIMKEMDRVVIVIVISFNNRNKKNHTKNYNTIINHTTTSIKDGYTSDFEYLFMFT